MPAAPRGKSLKFVLICSNLFSFVLICCLLAPFEMFRAFREAPGSPDSSPGILLSRNSLRVRTEAARWSQSQQGCSQGSRGLVVSDVAILWYFVAFREVLRPPGGSPDTRGCQSYPGSLPRPREGLRIIRECPKYVRIAQGEIRWNLLPFVTICYYLLPFVAL